MRVLLLEKDEKAARHVTGPLGRAGHHGVTCVACGENLVQEALRTAFDVLVIQCPDKGPEALRRLRSLAIRTPALFLFGLPEASALDAECLAPPFEDGALVARLAALAGPSAFRLGALEIRPATRSAHWQGRDIGLSPKEFTLLRLLAERAGSIVSRAELWEACWPDCRIPPQVNVIDVTMFRLRARLETATGAPMVRTIHRQGFILPAAP